MRQLHLILLTLVLVLGCSFSPGVRIGSTYFPLVTGAEWIYDVSSGGVAEIIIDGLEDSTYHTAINGVPYVFYRTHEGIYNIKDGYQTVDGEGIYFGTFHLFYMPDPPVDGMVYEDSIVSLRFHYGDTLRFFFKFRICVYYIGKMRVGENTFKEVYMLTRFETRNHDTLSTREWYAPGIGLIKREEGEVTWEIKEWFLP